MKILVTILIFWSSLCFAQNAPCNEEYAQVYFKGAFISVKVIPIIEAPVELKESIAFGEATTFNNVATALSYFGSYGWHVKETFYAEDKLTHTQNVLTYLISRCATKPMFDPEKKRAKRTDEEDGNVMKVQPPKDYAPPVQKEYR